MRIFRVSFLSQGKVYEIYAKRVQQGELYGFVEIHDLLLDETAGILVDPAVERLKAELKGVTRVMVPIHSMIRIDEVEKQGQSKVHDVDKGSNVTPFPSPIYAPPRRPDQ